MKFAAFALVISLVVPAVAFASPTIEDILQANNSAQQRYGVTRDGGLKCVIYADPDSAYYRYVFTGGALDNTGVGWTATYGGVFDHSDQWGWTLNSYSNELTFESGDRGDSIVFQFDPETLKFTSYTELLFSMNDVGRTCVLGN